VEKKKEKKSGKKELFRDLRGEKEENIHGQGLAKRERRNRGKRKKMEKGRNGSLP